MKRALGQGAAARAEREEEEEQRTGGGGGLGGGVGGEGRGAPLPMALNTLILPGATSNAQPCLDHLLPRMHILRMELHPLLMLVILP